MSLESIACVRVDGGTMPEVKGDGGKVVGSGTYICTCIRAPFCCVVLC